MPLKLEIAFRFDKQTVMLKMIIFSDIHLHITHAS